MFQRMNWERVAEQIAEHPNEDILLPEFTDTHRIQSLAQSVNYGQTIALRSLGGVVRASIRNSRMDGRGKGTRTGDLWLHWDPNADPADTYSARYLEQDRRAGRL